MDESLWPARNVGEFAYCPRLFYYMEVEGIHLPSNDTLEGVRIHRRVDSPSAEQADESPADEDRPVVARSLTLTSPERRLTARLDLAEINGQSAVPVEYRKGRPCHRSSASSAIAPQESEAASANDQNAAVAPWPTDRVQIGLQAILLEDAGYTVPHGVLYYAAEKRRLIVPVTSALKEEALQTLAAAVACAAGPRPLPLVNDPRCPRCSLQPICLPDEVNAARSREGSGTGDAKPRNLWPPRDDGIHIVAQQEGIKVGVRGASMVVNDADGNKVKDVPLAGVESLSLLGAVQISTQALHTLAERGIPIAFLTAAGRLTAIVDPLDSVSAETRRAQVREFDKPARGIELARALTAAKIMNQRKLLMRNHENMPAQAGADLATQADQAARAESLDSIRGHEGQAAAIYFGLFAGMIKSDVAAEFDANGRQRRPPPDPINSALSFAYSMLTHECTAALRVASLEPSIGAFHVSRPGRPALSLDLMEPFRPLISDSIVITAFNRGELKAGHFLRTVAGCAFTDAGRKAFFAVYGRRMADEITHPVFGYKLSYRRMITLHARMISAWLLGEIPSPAFLTTR